MTLGDLQQMQAEAMQKNDMQKIVEVEALYHQLLNRDPDNWAVLFFLGSVALYRGLSGMAIGLLHRAHQLNPKSPEVLNNLGTAYRKENFREQAEVQLKKALEITPQDPDLYNNLGTLHINEGSPEQGEPFFRKAIALKPDHGQAHWNLGLALLEQEKWAEGWKEYAWGIASKDRLTKNYAGRDRYAATWWDGEPHPDKTLVVYGEQGIGDEIMFASQIADLVPLFKKVIFDCHPRLVNMFRRAFPQVDCYPTRKTDKPEQMPWQQNYDRLDFKSSAGNLGRFLRPTEAAFPKRAYIAAPENQVADARARIESVGKGPYIGISWVGGHKRTRKDLRAILLEQWGPIFKAIPNATWISLQYTDQSWEYPAIKEKFGVTIHHFADCVESKRDEKYIVSEEDNGEGPHEFATKDEAKAFMRVRHGTLEHRPGPAFDFDKMAGLAQAITDSGGLIITVNNSLVHLCGAMGTKALVMTPSKPAWRYGLSRSDMVWYGPWIKQFRQQGDDWTPVIEQVAQEVHKHFLPKLKVVHG